MRTLYLLPGLALCLLLTRHVAAQSLSEMKAVPSTPIAKTPTTTKKPKIKVVYHQRLPKAGLPKEKDSRDDIQTLVAKGDEAFDGAEYLDAYHFYSRAGELGNAYAMFKAGLLCWGYLHPNDYIQAFYWLQKGSDKGNADSMVNLALLYRDGRGVRQDDAQYHFWMQKAATAGNERAIALLKLSHN